MVVVQLTQTLTKLTTSYTVSWNLLVLLGDDGSEHSTGSLSEGYGWRELWEHTHRIPGRIIGILTIAPSLPNNRSQLAPDKIVPLSDISSLLDKAENVDRVQKTAKRYLGTSIPHLETRPLSSSLPLKPSPSVVAACEAVTAVHRCRLLCPSSSYIGHPISEVLRFPILLNCVDKQVKQVHKRVELSSPCVTHQLVSILQQKAVALATPRHVSVVQWPAPLAHDRLQRIRQELTQATPDQPMDNEAVYYNVVGECPKGHVYALSSLGRKKRRYTDSDVAHPNCWILCHAQSITLIIVLCMILDLIQELSERSDGCGYVFIGANSESLIRVLSLPCWDLTETSKRDDGIDLLKDNQALQRLTGTAEKAKMDLSSLTQTNIREAGKIEGTVRAVYQENMVVRSNGAHKKSLVDEMMTSYQD
ncbi:hypothetical protein Syun_004260 [Stephania yunnanensis]|uniref:Uncharacterized protein n=1 Tax=Stephania yunnanensis TaxID=152371 RepID=A0AAP0Q110_9MAGN